MGLSLRQISQGIGDVVFPPECVHCRRLVEHGNDTDLPLRYLCVRCVLMLDFVRAPHCTTCGLPFYGVVEGARSCPHCIGLGPEFGEGRTAVLFKGPARALVIEPPASLTH